MEWCRLSGGATLFEAVQQAIGTLGRLVARPADGRALGGEPGQYG